MFRALTNSLVNLICILRFQQNQLYKNARSVPIHIKHSSELLQILLWIYSLDNYMFVCVSSGDNSFPGTHFCANMQLKIIGEIMGNWNCLQGKLAWFTFFCYNGKILGKKSSMNNAKNGIPQDFIMIIILPDWMRTDLMNLHVMYCIYILVLTCNSMNVRGFSMSRLCLTPNWLDLWTYFMRGS